MRMCFPGMLASMKLSVQIWQLAVITLMDTYLNSLVGSGIAIPDIPYVKLINPTVALQTGEIRVSADISYNGPTRN